MATFYPPPPVFIGGAQPFAPRLGIAQSGPTPQPPPIRGPLVAATFALLIGSWTPGPQPAQGSPRFVRPPPPVISQPPVKTNALLGVIRSTWELPFVLPQVGADVAPLLPAPVIAPPLPVPNAALRLIVDAWVDRSVTVITTTAIASVSNALVPPVVPNSAPYLTIRASWDAALTAAYYQGGSDIAPQIQAIQSPPVSSAAFWTVRSAWDATAPAVQLFEALDGIAPLIPAPATATQTAVNPVPYIVIRQAWEAAFQLPPVTAAIATQPVVNPPPVVNLSPQQTIRSAWDQVPQASQGEGDIAPLLSTANPPYSLAWLNSIIGSWQPPFSLPQIAPPVATQPIVSVPPIVTGAQLANLIAINQPPAYAIPKAGTVASWVPAPGAPSQPQPVSFATLFSLIRSWDSPVWWPLPSLRLLPQSGPAPSTLIPSSTRLILDAWQPAALPVQLRLGIAPLIQALGPPPPSQALLRLLLQSWDVGIQPTQDVQFVYPTIVIPSSPPPVNSALNRLLIGAWDVVAPPRQFSRVTQSGPPPSQPPPAGHLILLEASDRRIRLTYTQAATVTLSGPDRILVAGTDRRIIVREDE